MDLAENRDGRDSLVRTVLAVALALVALASLREGKRLRGVLAGVGALALGYAATGESTELAGTLDIETTDEEAELRCAICGDPIRPGQSRGPNEDNEIVHDDCR